jgi:hypothetical protein
MQVRGGPSKASAIRDVMRIGARTGMGPAPPHDRAHPKFAYGEERKGITGAGTIRSG